MQSDCDLLLWITASYTKICVMTHFQNLGKVDCIWTEVVHLFIIGTEITVKMSLNISFVRHNHKNEL